MGAALFTLNQRRPVSDRAKIWIGIGLIGYAIVTASLVTVANTPLQAVTWVPVCRSLLFAVITGISSVLFYGQARTTQQRGYAWLAGGYLYIAILNVADPLFRVGAFRAGAPLMGTDQSASCLVYLWVWFVPVGMVYSAWLLRPAVFNGDHQPRLRGGLTPRVAIVCLLASASIAFSTWAVPYLPTLIEPDGTYTPFNIAVSALWLPYAVVLTAVAVILALRCQTMIHRWLAAILLIILGHAIVGILTQPWSLGSYYNSVFTIVSASILLIVLLGNITRISVATNTAATRDELTGTASRLSLTNSITDDRHQDRDCALLWISIDGFEAVTTAIGHQQGDEALRVLAARFEKAVLDVGRLGRLGNSEFGIVVSSRRGVPAEQHRDVAIGVADNVLRVARESITLSGVTTWVTCSIGIASIPGQAQTTNKLLQFADLAMRSARGSGGDQFQWFNEDIGEADIGQALLRQQLNRSIQNSEFDLDYQPIVLPHGQQVIGVEALVRWCTDGERLAAGRFIGLAERTGQIVSIGRIVARKLADGIGPILDRLPTGGFVTFNLSVPELADDTIVDLLCRGPLAERSSALIVEITESIELGPRSKARANLSRLQAAGYRIAIDDFGSGFSNFAFLADTRPHLLKIDRSIVVRAGNQTDGGLAFLSAAVNVARSLNCAVLAEGIERAEEADVVIGLGIDYLQGYRFGRPTPLDALLRDLPEHDRTVVPWHLPAGRGANITHRRELPEVS
ncbi:MAG: EAL domain-containing protein [Actinomycetes bacterium]